MVKLFRSSKSSCPSASQLAAFDEGMVSDGQFLSVSLHLASCGRCVALLEQSHGNATGGRAYSRSPYLGEENFARFAHQVADLTISSEEELAASPIANSLSELEDRFMSDGSIRYKILKILGHGSFGEVFLAEDALLERKVAIKAPRLSEFASDTSIEAFLEEARLAAALEHPNIVPIYDVCRIEPDRAMIVMQYIEGSTLASLIQSRKLPIDRSVSLVIEIANAIHFAHDRGVVHRDLKPSNILMDENDQVHISDFGLGVCLSKSQSEDVIHGGSPPYMAPEQVRRETWRIDRRTDVWSLGIILAELISDERPFSGDDRNQVYSAILYDPPGIECESSGPSLSSIVVRCLEKDPGKRPQSAAELAEELSNWLQRYFPNSNERKIHRLKMTIVATAVAIFILAALTGFAIRNYSISRDTKDAVDDLASCRASEVPELTDRLKANRAYAKKLLDESYAVTTSKSVKFHLLCGLSSIGELHPEELLDCLPDLPQDGIVNLVGALSADKINSLACIRDRIEKSKQVGVIDAKLRIIAMELGEPEHLWQMSEFGVDPTMHYQLRSIWRHFHGSVKNLQSAIACSDADDFAMLATYVLGELFRDASIDDRSRIREALNDLYCTNPSGKVHSSAAWALKVNGLDLPRLRDEERQGQGWVVLDQDDGQEFCLVRIPSTRTDSSALAGKSSWEFFISTTEVSNGVYGEFDPEHQVRLRDRYGDTFDHASSHSVRFVSALQAMQFCNWLSERNGLEKCYSGLDGGATSWHVNRDANGFRLPDEEEWVHANLAMSQHKFFFGDDYSRVSLHARISSLDGTTKQMHFPPNGFGVFDTLGNVSEFCHDRAKRDAISVLGGSIYSLPVEFGRELKFQRDVGFNAVDVGFRVVSRLVYKEM